jgi:hypothetical protein
MTLLALVGAKALYAIFVWLGSAALAGWLADRKGYPERWGLASGLILLVIGPIIWLVVPARKFEDPAAKDAAS